MQAILGTGEKGTQALQCEKCHTPNFRVTPETIFGAKRRQFPYYNQSTGTTFESADHEKRYAAENKLEPMN